MNIQDLYKHCYVKKEAVSTLMPQTAIEALALGIITSPIFGAVNSYQANKDKEFKDKHILKEYGRGAGLGFLGTSLGGMAGQGSAVLTDKILKKFGRPGGTRSSAPFLIPLMLGMYSPLAYLKYRNEKNK